MKKETFSFICPSYYLPYIFNSDKDGLTAEEIKSIDSVLNGFNLFEVKGEPFFSYRNDFDTLGSECISLNAYK